ncbi:MAG: hypothetical protein COA80_16380 [Leeuwenhoekiella sp.]|nr:MAG: hypothetical protein COA80_16380 [Leeuwenhoekiella sp.]
MRNLIWALGFFIFLTGCAKSPETETDLIHLIPQKTAAILRVPQWENFKNNLQSSKLLKLSSETRFYTELDKKSELLKHFNPSQESYITWIALGDDDYDLALISKASKNIIPADSAFTKLINSYAYEGITINGLKINNTEVFYIRNDCYFLASTSKLILENTILQSNSGRDPEDESLKKILKTSSAQSPNLLINGAYYKSLFRDIFDHYRFQNSKPAFDWVAVDLEIEPDALEISGVLQFSKQTNQSSELLANLEPTSSDIADFIPVNARGYSYFNIQDWETYKSNLASHRGALLKDFQLSAADFMSSTKGIGSLTQEDNTILVTSTSDPENAEIQLRSISGEAEIFRDLPIRKLTDSSLFQIAFKELFNPPAVHYYMSWDNHFFFARTMEELKDLTANYQNGAVLSNDASYKQFRKNLSDTYTAEYYTNLPKSSVYLSKKLSKENAQGLKDLDLQNYPHAAMQLSASDDYLYLNGGVYETPVSQTKSQVVQLASIKLDNDLLNTPQFLKNYRTKGQNILVQDVSNTLYQINQSGKIDWKKQLDGPILGTIEQVDLYKNGRLQYAFVTPHHFYVIASDETIVKPFDLDYKNTITQPLAVFDYDGNREYRFVLVQDRDVQMLDREANSVKGFKYDKAETGISKLPQHIRISNKDYLLFPLANGDLKILSRTGDVRVKVGESFKFSDYPVFTEQSNFVVVEPNGTKISISQSGKVSRPKSNTNTDVLFARNGSMEAKLKENVLSIGSTDIELDLGIYKGLQVFTIGSSSYVALSDLQTNKAFIYSSKGKLLPNFPVYAASQVDLAASGNSGNLLLTCKGESDSVIIYQINP